jgi:hypothetical protein
LKSLPDDEFFSADTPGLGFPADSSAALDGAAGQVPEGDKADSPARPDTYWSLSRTPLTSLVFSLPLVLAYEGGVLLLGRGSPRNGADVWLRHLLDGIGFGAYFLLPVLTVIGLLAWHHVEYDRWRLRPGLLAAMALETLVWAFFLVSLNGLQESLWPLQAAGPDPVNGMWGRLVGSCGAGLYEEVLFRLLALPMVAWMARKAGSEPLAASTWAVLLTSLAFSAAHYVGPLGDVFDIYSFTFRLVAGMFFAVLFLVRGFGITAGTHATYDVIVSLL